MTLRAVAGVTLLWLLVAVVSGAQASLAAALQGRSEPLGAAIGNALHHNLAWVPGTLAVVALALRHPVRGPRWRRSLAIHALAVPFVAFGTNALVVLGYWARQGSFQGLGPLVREGARWGLSRLDVAVVLYAAAAGLTQAVASWRGLQRRELELARLETQLSQARLQALSAQIQPHFLFNTLHAIGQLWRSGRDDEADALLDHLGALFQKVIAWSSRPRVPLADELQMVRDYLAIEQVRLGERLRTRIDADAVAQAAAVPPLILQPLVENAVKHGVAPSVAGGEVVLAARLDGGRLVVVVSDDGPGAPSPAGAGGSGVGLSNVRARLLALYGDGPWLEVARGAERGTRVRLVIPQDVPADA
jgi:signal transduction histidine kinase